MTMWSTGPGTVQDSEVNKLEAMLAVPTATRVANAVPDRVKPKRGSFKRLAQKVAPYVLPTMAASSFDTAAFLNGPVAGLVVTGLSLFFLEWRFEK